MTLGLGETARRRSRFGEKHQELRLGHIKYEKPLGRQAGGYRRGLDRSKNLRTISI